MQQKHAGLRVENGGRRSSWLVANELTQILYFVPGNSSNLPVVAFTHNLFVVFAPISAFAVPPVTVLLAVISVANLVGHVDVATTVVVEVPLAVLPLAKVTLKVDPVELDTSLAEPPVSVLSLHPVADALAAVPLRVPHVTIVGAANAAVTGPTASTVAGTASAAPRAPNKRRTNNSPS